MDANRVMRVQKTPYGTETIPMSVQTALPMLEEQHGEIRVYRLMFPYLPPSKNVYDNWPAQWKQSAKRKWEKKIVEECLSVGMPRVNKVGLAATLVFPSKARRDLQNYAQALWHWVPDGLQKAGVLDDDREGHVEIGPNWGLRFAYDLRSAPKAQRQRTILSVSMEVPR